MRTQNETPARLPLGWQQELREAIRSLDELARALGLPPDALADGRGALTFPLLVPRSFAGRMRHGDPNDPLLRQVLPAPAETVETPGFGPDPLAESGFTRSGVIRKYASRALLVTTAACPVHCRYCFRREFPYSAQSASADDWQPALAALKEDASIREAILSGGDPLSLSDSKLAQLIERLEAIAHIDTIRLHTRFPIMIPSRITAGLTDLLRLTRLKTVVVVHTNHPQEIDTDVASALAALKSCTAALLNQSVLLADVNDDHATLETLSRRLFDCGVLPYYLHMLDPVTGAAHFDVMDEQAGQLIATLRASLPGYLVPKLVREVAGELSKSPVI